MKLKYVYAVCLVCCLIWSPSCSDPSGKEENSAQQPETKPAEAASGNEKEGVLNLPGLKVDVKNRQVRLEAEICLEQGILEYLVCLPGTFEHEAIFVTKTKPEVLHAGLLMIGMRPYPLDNHFWWMGIPRHFKSHLNIEVQWKNEGIAERMPLNRLLINRGDGGDGMMFGEPAPDDDSGEDDEIEYAEDAWVFSGSFFHRRQVEDKIVEVYAANLEGVIIGIWPQPSAVVQYGRESLNPYRGDNQGFEMNSEECPEKGTKVELIFSPRKQPIKPVKVEEPEER